jgi:NADPH-dependent curcumin reductase CurA
MNRRVLLISRPSGVAQVANFHLDTQPIAQPQEGQIQVRNLYLSVEPAMRGWIADAGNYSAQIELGSVMRSLAVGTVVQSRCGGWETGDILVGWFGWQEFATIEPGAVICRVQQRDIPPSLALGVLGINGVTAYLALTGIGTPNPGETVLVSTAAGAVGSAAGQIGRILGCRTVGITGGPAKVDICKREFGYDEALNYQAPDLRRRIGEACPNGVDIYFDNTAGPISDAVHPHLAKGARVIVCGTSAITDWRDWPIGPRVERHLLLKRARMQGFVIFDYMDQWEKSVSQLTQWVREGKLRYREEITDGIDTCLDALAGLYRGDNLGKRLVRLC